MSLRKFGLVRIESIQKCSLKSESATQRLFCPDFSRISNPAVAGCSVFSETLLPQIRSEYLISNSVFRRRCRSSLRFIPFRFLSFAPFRDLLLSLRSQFSSLCRSLFRTCETLGRSSSFGVRRINNECRALSLSAYGRSASSRYY